MPRRKVADVEPVEAERGHLGGLAFGQEPVDDAALVEDLEGARMQAAGARSSMSWFERRSRIATSMPASASSPASIMPVGPAPAISTA